MLICGVLGLLAATPVLATSTLLRNELKPVLAALADTPDTQAAPTRPELAAGTVSGLHLDAEWIRTTAAAADIPERALSAYAAATLTIQHEFPNCKLGWNMLAAIGEVETRHGTIYGATLGDDGVAAPAITGPALDGGGAFKSIPDTDNGALDGDATWDRAVGPMQFIPQTWERYGRDGNGDDIADPQNIDDAALSAAALLCTAGGDLSQNRNWTRAVYAYNHSAQYHRDVADAANRYASFHP